MDIARHAKFLATLFIMIAFVALGKEKAG